MIYNNKYLYKYINIYIYNRCHLSYRNVTSITINHAYCIRMQV